MKDGWRGIFSIAATPFDEKGNLLFDELKNMVDWIVRCGAHGIVWPVNHSERSWLSYQERMKGTPLVVEAAAGRCPVIIGVAAECQSEALAYAKRAAECGADGVIAIPPKGWKSSRFEVLKDFYSVIAEAAGLPMFLQNKPAPWGGMSPETIVRLCREIDLAEYVKDESGPASQSTQKVMDICGDSMSGVMGGSGCMWLVSEMKRGISGSFPGAPVTDICVQIWNRWHEGKKEEARELHNLQAAYQRLFQGMPAGARKHVYVRRGVISTAFSRIPEVNGTARLDPIDSEELDYAIKLLEPYFTV